MPNEKEIARLERRLEHEAYGIEYEQKNAGEQIAAALATMQRFLDERQTGRQRPRQDIDQTRWAAFMTRAGLGLRQHDQQPRKRDELLRARTHDGTRTARTLRS